MKTCRPGSSVGPRPGTVWWEILPELRAMQTSSGIELSPHTLMRSPAFLIMVPLRVPLLPPTPHARSCRVHSGMLSWATVFKSSRFANISSQRDHQTGHENLRDRIWRRVNLESCVWNGSASLAPGLRALRRPKTYSIKDSKTSQYTIEDPRSVATGSLMQTPDIPAFLKPHISSARGNIPNMPTTPCPQIFRTIRAIAI